MKALMLLAGLIAVVPAAHLKGNVAARDACLGIWAGASSDDEDEDFGKEVLAQRESQPEDGTALLTRVSQYSPADNSNPAGH